MNTPHLLNIDNKPGAVTTTSPVIRTPDQRVSVFVSSTLDELAQASFQRFQNMHDVLFSSLVLSALEQAIQQALQERPASP